MFCLICQRISAKNKSFFHMLSCKYSVNSGEGPARKNDIGLPDWKYI